MDLNEFKYQLNFPFKRMKIQILFQSKSIFTNKADPFYIHLHIILILDSAYERKHMVFAFLNLDHYVQYNNCQLYPFS